MFSIRLRVVKWPKERQDERAITLQEMHLDDGTGIVVRKLWQEHSKVGMTAGADVIIANEKVRIYY